ncbi:MAG: amidoligase family protein, partial [Pseudomonadota bacterium]
MADDQSFRPLPHPDTADGTPRKVGVEIEFAGLTEAESAALAQQNLGGQTAPDGPRTLKVTESELGTLEIVLDTALRRFDGNVLIDAGLDAARGLVPVEIVTEPLNLSDLPTLDAFRASLREAGAIGTADGVLLGFGVHFNVAVVAPDDTHTLNTVRAFALCE